tara:strand:- start:449 stop:769 length:321 start_codon:yes stop_codon:yes gene_type:complete
LPIVTFLGPFFERRRRDSHESWIRNTPVEVSQAWLDEWRHSLPASHFLIESEEATTIDAGNDGLPDSGWSRKDILAWMNNNEVSTGSGYLTKTAALKLVEEHLSNL